MIIDDSTAGMGCQGKKADEQGRQSTAGERSFSSSIVPRPSSLRSPEGAVAIRIPRPNPRLSSPVPRKPRGISRGPQPPGRWGRIPKGTAFGIGSLWRFLFPVSFPLKETGSRRSAKSPRLVFGPTAAGDSPGVFRIRISPLRFVPLSRRLRRPTFSTWRK